jgi:hypothetical protein
MKQLVLIAIALMTAASSCESRWRAASNYRRYGPWGPGITSWEEERAQQKAREKAATEKARLREELRQKTEQFEKLKRPRSYPYFQLDVF